MKKLFSTFLALVMLISMMVPMGMLSASAESDVVLKTDFSEDYYATNTYVKQYNGTHGKAMMFNRVSISTDNWGNAQIWGLGNAEGTLKLPIGATLDVSMELIKNKLTPATAGGTDYRDFSIGIIYLNDTEASRVTGAQSAYNLGFYSDRIIKIADVKGTISSDWEIITSTIKVPSYNDDAKAYLVLCGNGYQTGFTSEIWVDNIIFTESEKNIIDFSEDFYSDNSNTNAKNYNLVHGNALRFNRVSVATENWGNAHVWELGDADGTLKLPIGATFDVSFELSRDKIKPDNNGIIRGFSVGILYLNDTERDNVKNQVANNCLNKYSSRIMKLADVEGVVTSNWETFTSTITVPEYAEDAKAYMVLYADYQSSADGTTEINIDNIVFAPSADVNIDIDFSESYFTDNTNTKVSHYDAAHGNALKFERVSVATENWGNAHIWELGDDSGALKLPAGETLDISLELIKNKLTPITVGGTDYRDFSIGILYLNDAEANNVRSGVANNCLNKYASRIMKVADVKGTISSGWEVVTGTITVPEYYAEAKAYMVLYGNYQTTTAADRITEVWVDNIKIQTPVDTVVGDFDGDGAIGAEDITILSKVLLGSLDEYDQAVADVNVDGSVNILDLIALKKSAAKQ